MDCLFFRHGIAIERQEWSGEEQDRPLTGKGAARTRESGKGLLTLRIKPTHIFSSPLARAHETAAILQSLIRSNPKIRICSELDPTAAPRTLFALLDTLPADAVNPCCTGVGTGSGCFEGIPAETCFTDTFSCVIRTQDAGTPIGKGLRSLIWAKMRPAVLTGANNATLP